jgi:hypothetical protein
MLIFNDEQRLRAGIRSLSKPCSYCSKALSEYPLIMNDDSGFAVFHAACAAALATEIIGRTWVSCPMGRVVGIRRRKGQLLAMIYGWGRWYPVEHVLIVAARTEPALSRPPSEVSL